MMEVLVFDLGGTLMEYRGMPPSWVDYYKQGFQSLNRQYQCDVSTADIDKSIEMLKTSCIENFTEKRVSDCDID